MLRALGQEVNCEIAELGPVHPQLVVLVIISINKNCKYEILIGDKRGFVFLTSTTWSHEAACIPLVITIN